MKKLFTLMAVAALMAACFGNANKPAETTEEVVVVEETTACCDAKCEGCTCEEGTCTCAEGTCTCGCCAAKAEAAPAETPVQ